MVRGGEGGEGWKEEGGEGGGGEGWKKEGGEGVEEDHESFIYARMLIQEVGILRSEGGGES